MWKWITTVVLALGMIFTSMSSLAQCRGFAKKNCLPVVEEDAFKFNGQINTATLFPGDNADVMLTFYSGKEYRLLVCTQEILGDVVFQLKDTSGNLFFDSKGKDKNYFDFNVQSTRQLVLTITVPESKSLVGLQAEGCISVMVGHK